MHVDLGSYSWGSTLLSHCTFTSCIDQVDSRAKWKITMLQHEHVSVNKQAKHEYF
jgi:hypothetical protein